MELLGNILGVVMYACYQLTHNYGVAIILFTLATKFVLLPLNVWFHKNSIKIVKMQADINNIKAEYYGDPSMIAEKQSELYKKEKYNPLISLIPLAIQIVLLMGLVEVIYHPLTYILRLPVDIIEQLQASAAGTLIVDPQASSVQLSIVEAIQSGSLQNTFGGYSMQLLQAVQQIKTLQVVFLGLNICWIPSVIKGWMILIPVTAALSSWLLCLFQNSQQVLQSEQGLVNKYGTMSISVALSLYLGWFVPAGVAIYWVCSNLFSIIQTTILNRIINPKKYVDYEKLRESRGRLAAIEALQPDKKSQTAKENAKREKQDYKRFFSIANKHLVFYSEKSGFYKYFRDVIEYLIENSNVIVHYVTNDPNDQIFAIARNTPQIHPYYIGLKKTISLMMRMDADIVVMTTPDLQNYYIKRSYVRKDIEYIYLFHGLTSTNMVVRKGAYDHFDTIFCAGQHQIDELREAEFMYGLPEKKLVPYGYSMFDDLIKKYAVMEKKESTLQRILIAPSWQEGNLMESCIDNLLDSLFSGSYAITVRPHPEFIKRFPNKMKDFQERYRDRLNENFAIETDFSSNSTIFMSDLLITDWSGIAYEFSFCTLKPSLFIDTPMKVLNPDYVKYKNQPTDIIWRNMVGKSIQPNQADRVLQVVQELLSEKERYHDRIKELRSTSIFNIGESGKVGAKYILSELIKKKTNA